MWNASIASILQVVGNFLRLYFCPIMIESLLTSIVAVLLLVLFILYAYKVAQHYALLHLKKYRKLPDNPWACWKSGANKSLRNEALLLYPLFFPVDFDDNDSEAIRTQKSGIKRINILIYWVLIVVLLVGIYVSKSQ
ncbi:MAG: hypothetical protein JJU02_07735 [Cryomorphaceae bacterium]|nr:hypothetical protein [Cryomorphaceae bacterium]